MTLLQRAFGSEENGIKQLYDSCLIQEILKKILADVGKFKKTSVFICTNEELVKAVKRKNPYAGVAEAIISGREDLSGLDFGIDL